MMKRDIKNKELQERLGYASPSVDVIEVTVHGVLCGSNPNGPEQYGTDNW